MSDLRGARRRRRRSDGERSAAAVLDAAVQVLGQQPDATLDQVAAAAGVTRQTVYAHYPSRPLLVAAVIDRITAEAVAALDAAEARHPTVTGALLTWLDVTWQLLEKYPLLRHPSAAAAGPEDAERQHAPISERLTRLVRRGQTAGEFDRTADAAWLVAATIALGHAAGAELAAGRMTATQAAASLRATVLRLLHSTTQHAGSPTQESRGRL